MCAAKFARLNRRAKKPFKCGWKRPRIENRQCLKNIDTNDDDDEEDVMYTKEVFRPDEMCDAMGAVEF